MTVIRCKHGTKNIENCLTWQIVFVFFASAGCVDSRTLEGSITLACLGIIHQIISLIVFPLGYILVAGLEKNFTMSNVK